MPKQEAMLSMVKAITPQEFEKQEEKAPVKPGDTIITRLDRALGKEKAGIFTLDVRAYSGLMRHIARAGEKALFEAKVTNFKGVGNTRTYTVAVKRAR